MSSRRQENGGRRNGILNFTLFVILPTEDVCSLRSLTSGVTIREVRCRLELMAGIPAQIYRLVSANDIALHEEHQLVLEKNVWDGFIIRIQLHESWVKLYRALLSGDGQYVVNHGAVHYQNQQFVSREEEETFKGITAERGFVSLFIASYYGHVKVCQLLLSLDVNVNARSPFNRTPLHAAVSRDHDRVMDLLIQYGGSTDVKDVVGDSVELVARKCFSKQCVRKLRIMKLQGTTTNGYIALNGNSDTNLGRKSNASMIPSPPNSESPRPNTGPNARTTKSHPVASVGAKSLPLLVENEKAEVMSYQYFMWDTDKPGPRGKSALNDRPGTSSRRAVVSRTGTANSRHAVTWDESTPRTPNRHSPHKLVSPPQQTSILKNRGDHWATIPSRISASRDSARHVVRIPNPPRAQSEHGSRFSVASAPGIGDASSGNNSDARSVESAPEMQVKTSGENSSSPRPGTSSTDAVKRPRTRLLVSRHRKNESWRTMKRRIQMAESKKKYTDEDQKKRETFDQWLHRKRNQEKRGNRESDSEESDSGNEGGNPRAFEEWLKAQRERKTVRPQTVAVADLYRKPRSLQVPVDSSKDPNEYIVSYRKWRVQHKKDGSEHTKDIETAKKRLEQKRQTLLARAISYEEWMEHNEDRKQLMKQILHADMMELERIEEEKLKKRTSRQVSYAQWRERSEKQALPVRGDRPEVELKQRKDFRSNTSVPHDAWLKKKDEQRRGRLDREKEHEGKVKLQTNGSSTEAYDLWLEKKHQQNMAEIQTEIKRERDMIKVLRDRRIASVSMC